jgi:cell division protein FtsB
MKEFQEKHKIRQKKRSRIVLFFMLILLISLVRGTTNTYFKERESRVEVDRVMKEKQELEKRYAVMSEQSEALKSDIGVESEIRSKFDVAKEGEGVIVIVEKDTPIIEGDKRGVLRKFWDGVRGVFGSE